jgi:hypothetical protein
MNRGNREGGFTVIEGVTALAIISVVGMITLSLPGSAARALSGSLKPLFFTLGVLRAEALIRDRVSAVRVPYWEKTAFPREGPPEETPSITIPWYEGDARAALRLAGEDGTLYIETVRNSGVEHITLLEDLDDLSLSVQRGRGGVPLGVSISCGFRGLRFRIDAPFASIPLPEEGP